MSELFIFVMGCWFMVNILVWFRAFFPDQFAKLFGLGTARCCLAPEYRGDQRPIAMHSNYAAMSRECIAPCCDPDGSAARKAIAAGKAE